MTKEAQGHKKLDYATVFHHLCNIAERRKKTVGGFKRAVAKDFFSYSPPTISRVLFVYGYADIGEFLNAIYSDYTAVKSKTWNHERKRMYEYLQTNHFVVPNKEKRTEVIAAIGSPVTREAVEDRSERMKVALEKKNDYEEKQLGLLDSVVKLTEKQQKYIETLEKRMNLIEGQNCLDSSKIQFMLDEAVKKIITEVKKEDPIKEAMYKLILSYKPSLRDRVSALFSKNRE